MMETILILQLWFVKSYEPSNEIWHTEQPDLDRENKLAQLWKWTLH